MTQQPRLETVTGGFVGPPFLSQICSDSTLIPLGSDQVEL